MPRRELQLDLNGRNRPSTIISPSILSADFANLSSECKDVLRCGADWLHVDIMDGHFVPNLTIGPCVVASIRQHTDAFLDCHMMLSDPKQWVQEFAKAGTDMYTFHLEAVIGKTDESDGNIDSEVTSLINDIRDAGMYVGVAISPSTSENLLVPYLERGLIDLVLIVTVEPGFGGQSYKEECASKVKALRNRFPSLLIEVDGGIKVGSTVESVAKAGANVIVAGTAVFLAEDRAAVIASLRAAVEKEALTVA